MKLIHILYGLLFVSLSTAANNSVTLYSDQGDSLMIHQLKNGELWGSFIVTDQIAESFAEHEMIVMQIDQLQPINLQGKRSCGGAAGKPKTVDYQFESSEQDWLFNKTVHTETDVFAVLWMAERERYRILSVDRRYEWLDFPIHASVGLPELFQQFQAAQKVVFRYTTQNFEQRLAEFKVDRGIDMQLDRLLNRQKAP